MKNKHKLIIILIIITLVIIIALLALIINLSKNTEDKAIVEKEQDDYVYYQENPAQLLNGKVPEKTQYTNIYYAIDNCIKSYLNMIKANQSEIVLAYLNDEYIKEKSIDKNNIFNKIEKYSNYDSYRTTEMYELAGRNYATYYIKGTIDKKSVYFTVNTDNSNNTFDIIQTSESEYLTKIKEQYNTDESQEKVIDKKTYNYITYPNYTDEKLASIYLADYIKLMVNNSEEAYKMLNEQYQGLKFGTLDSFNKYINSKKNALELTYRMETIDIAKFENFSEYNSFKEKYENYGMKQYSKIEYDDYTEFICTDGYDNYYIFDITNPGEYKVMLDSYTLDTTQFINKYDKSTNENKIALNADKIKNAINTKDYRYVYNKLNDSFKNNNYKTQESFSEYIKTNLFEYNNFEYTEIKQEGDIYILNIKITDKTGKSNVTKMCNLIMQLKENRDFVMSFSIE